MAISIFFQMTKLGSDMLTHSNIELVCIELGLEHRDKFS